MKHYKDTDYAANRYSENIVYRFGNKIVEITLEMYLAENPDMTEEDFLLWKTLSDSLYKEQDYADYNQTRKNLSITELEGLKACAVKPIDEYIEEQEEKVALQTVQRFLNSDILTETQKRRFILYFLNGLTVRQIAKLENTHHKSIEETIIAAIKKLKKFL